MVIMKAIESKLQHIASPNKCIATERQKIYLFEDDPRNLITKFVYKLISSNQSYIFMNAFIDEMLHYFLHMYIVFFKKKENCCHPRKMEVQVDTNNN